MVDYNINNKDYLLSINPSYKFIPLLCLVSVFIVLVSIIYFKTYDVYVTKGYLECEEKCNIIINTTVEDINKIIDADVIKLNDKEINYNNILIGDIQIDEINKINIQSVNIEVDQLDNDLLRTFQDVKIYSNYESIFNKVKKVLF